MTTTWTAAASRYEAMPYRRLGSSGLKLPALSLGLWHNFGSGADPAVARELGIQLPMQAGKGPFRPGQQLRSAPRGGGNPVRPHPDAGAGPLS